MQLTESIDILKGVGKKRKEILEKNNILTIEDLLNYFPTKYEDKSVLGTLKDSVDKVITVKAKVVSKGAISYRGYKKSSFKIIIEDTEGTKAEILYFNQPYLISQFKENAEYYFYGKVHKNKNQYQLFVPKFTSIENSKDFLSIEPIYKNIEGVPQAVILKLIHSIFENIHVKEFLPKKYRDKYELISLEDMYYNLHRPKDTSQLNEARKRLKFNEGLKVNTGIYSSNLYPESTDIVITNFNVISSFLQNLPFDLTNAQEHVLRDVFRDLESGFLMNRMIMGDVGSGKTIIAIICAYLMAMNGLQTAYMAPTEILAKQHYENFRNLLEPFNIKVSLLTGSMKNSEIEEIRTALAKGDTDIIIGTHSLIQENTRFYNLGLIVTDEQHRFGVKQRGQFSQKGSAHTLVMSATPIPRTLALTLYGDLKVSEIDELPAGRQKVKTSFYTFKKFKKILNFIENEINKGHQAFIVCPYIEESEEDKSVVSIDKAYDEISGYVKDRFKIAKLHGKMKTEEKEKIVQAFNNKEIDLLIATSIIEVGINVPNVTVMTILSADRFGLSQLHQLRGRTGRSNLQSYCFLVSNNVNETTIERMRTIVNCHNGKEIAIADLKLRGPGDYFGFNQHGYNNIKILDPIYDKDLIKNTKETIKEIFISKKAEDMYCKDYLLEAFNKDTKLITLN